MVHKRPEHGLTSPPACCSSELTHRNPSICTHTASIFLCNSNSNSDSDNNIPTRCQTVPPGRTSRDLSALQSLARLRPHRNTCKAPTRTAACQHPLHTHKTWQPGHLSKDTHNQRLFLASAYTVKPAPDPHQQCTGLHAPTPALDKRLSRDHAPPFLPICGQTPVLAESGKPQHSAQCGPVLPGVTSRGNGQ
jgi:hypothetical protein